MAELSFEEVFGTQSQKELSFDEVFGQQPKQKKTKEQLIAEVGQAQAARDQQYPPESQNFVERLAGSDAAGGVMQGISRLRPDILVRDMLVGLSDPIRFIGGNGGLAAPSQLDQPIIPPDAARKAVEFFTPGGVLPEGSLGKGVQDFTAESVSGMSAPIPLTTMIAGGLAAKLGMPQQAAQQVALQFVPPMIEDSGQALEQIRTAESDQERAAGLLRLGSDVLFPAGMLKAAQGGPKPSGLKAGDIADTRNPIYDRPGGGDLIGPERQLAAPGQGPTVPMGLPIDRPAGAARFGVDPSGRVIDLSQLTPLEQTEAYRGPKQFVPRESYVRPAQEAPIVLGEQKPSRIKEIQIEEPKIIEPATSFIPKQDVVGGQVSFAAPAEARAIPSARQSALDIQKPAIEEVPTKIVPPVEESGLVTKQKPEVAKLSTSTNKNPLGDPMGTTYHATPEDWTAWQGVQSEFKGLLEKGAEFDGPEMMKVRQANEDIKNRYGGMPPQPPKGGMQIKAAVEKNKEAGSVYNFFRSKDPVKEAQGSKEVVNDFSPLPPVEKIKEMLKPQGAGRVPLIGAKIDPRMAEMDSPQGQALISHYKTTQVGDAMSSLMLTTSANKFGRNPFELSKTPGKVKLASGKEVFLGDAIEAYLGGENVGFNPKEKAAVDHAVKIMKQAAETARAEGVKKFVEHGGDEIDLSLPYFHRSAIGKIKNNKAVVEGRGTVRNKKAIGSERGIQKGRQFVSQEMGWDKEGIVYDNDLWSVVGDYTKQIYRAIADERLAKDPALKGEKEAKFMETALSYHPAFKGRKFNQEAIEKIHKYLEDHPDRSLRKVDSFIRYSKAVQFGADFATSMNQLLSLPFRPKTHVAGVKSPAIGMKALFDESVIGKWLARPENNQMAKRLAEAGVDVVQLAEFLPEIKRYGLKPEGQSEAMFQFKKMASDPNQYPIIKQSNRAMAAQFAVAKVELGKAFWPLVEEGKLTKQEWGELITDITGTSTTQGIGVRPSRAIWERVFFNSPTILRSAANSLADAMNPKAGRKGWEQRKTLGSLYLGTAALTSAALYSLYQSGEISEEEFKERMKPSNMTVPVQVGDQRLNVGFGGTYIAIAKMLARTGEQAMKPGSVMDVEDQTFQPVRGFATGRMSTILQLAKNVATKEDYKGDPVSLFEAILASFTPVGAQAFYESDRQNFGTQTASFGIQSLGLQTSPENVGQQKRRLEFEEAKKTYGVKSLAELNTTQRALVQQKAEKIMSQENVSARDRANAGRRAMEAASQRERRVGSFLSTEVKGLLEASGLHVPQVKAQGKTDSRYYNLENKLTQIPVKFNRQEQEMFEEKFGQELNKRLELVLKDGSKKISKDRFEAITRSVREMVVNQIEQGINVEAARRAEEKRSRQGQR